MLPLHAPPLIPSTRIFDAQFLHAIVVTNRGWRKLQRFIDPLHTLFADGIFARWKSRGGYFCPQPQTLQAERHLFLIMFSQWGNSISVIRVEGDRLEVCVREGMSVR